VGVFDRATYSVVNIYDITLLVRHCTHWPYSLKCLGLSLVCVVDAYDQPGAHIPLPSQGRVNTTPEVDVPEGNGSGECACLSGRARYIQQHCCQTH
jgi:hypothetical protein